MPINDNLNFLAGGGEMGALIRGHDWASSLMGPPPQWPQGLRTAVRLMLNTRHPMYIFWGPEGCCLYNDAYRQSIGPDRHPGSLGLPAQSVWPEIWFAIGPQIEQVRRGGGATWHENQLLPIMRGERMEEVYWTYSYSPIDDDDAPGGIGGVLVVCTETTQQVVAAKRLAETEERLQMALSAGRGVGTWDWDVVKDRVVADERFAKLYGVEASKARDGAPLADFFARIHPDDVADVHSQVERALHTGEQFSAEYRLVQDDGGSVWVVAEGRCELSADGKPLRFPGVSFDISARKGVEDRLRELNAELERKVIERAQTRGRTWQVTPDLLGALNARGYFETSNPAWKTLLGWTEQEVAGMSIFELLHPDDVERTRSGFNLTQQGQPAIGFPNRYRCKDGSYRWISWVGVPEDGLVYCSGRDITNEVEQEAALKRTEETLRQAQKMEALGQLTGGIAHDFNNMLQGIVMPLQLIGMRLGMRQYEGLDRYVQAGLDSAFRAASITQRLLAFSRRQPLANRSVALAAALEGLTDLLRNTVGENVSVVFDIEGGLWNVLTDAHQFESAVLNLAINARDAMPQGGRMTLRARNVTLSQEQSGASDGLAAGDYVQMSVCDTGMGMSADVIAQAFEPFFTTKPMGQGTGLGLSMIYGYARQSKGTVTIDSATGAGTSVHLFLPREHSAAAPGAQPAHEHFPAGGDVRRILVVEDDDVVRHMCIEVLADQGYEVAEAANGHAAMGMLASGAAVDLLLTDVGLPGPNGRLVADFALGRMPDVKVVLMTGYAAHVASDLGLVQGRVELLTKPFSADALVRQVGALLRG